ncbi:MAG: HigA family addiction module antitoxin [Propioniciclava sp.]
MSSQPVHPGVVLNRKLPAELGPGIGQAAAQLGISPVALSRVLHAHESITPELASTLERAGIGMASTWLSMQAAYDQARS